MLASGNPFVSDNGYDSSINVSSRGCVEQAMCTPAVLLISQVKKNVNLLPCNPPAKILKPYL